MAPMNAIDPSALSAEQRALLVNVLIVFGDFDTLSVDDLETIGISTAKRAIGQALRRVDLKPNGRAVLQILDRDVSRMGRRNDGA